MKSHKSQKIPFVKYWNWSFFLTSQSATDLQMHCHTIIISVANRRVIVHSDELSWEYLQDDFHSVLKSICKLIAAWEEEEEKKRLLDSKRCSVLQASICS